MYHTLGFTCSSRGKYNKQQCIRVQLCKFKHFRNRTIDKLIPRDAVFNVMNTANISVIMENNYLLRLHLCRLIHHTKSLTLVMIAISGKQQFWMQLFKAVNSRIRTDVRGTGALCSTHCHSGKHGDNCFGNIGHLYYTYGLDGSLCFSDV